MHPLDATWIERPLDLDLGDAVLRVLARANWGAVEVELSSPVAHLTRRWDGRGWAFAMMAGHRPESRYAFQGELTARGEEAARAMAAELYRDWVAVRTHGGGVEAACRRVRADLADIDRAAVSLRQPVGERQAALRRAFRAGELSQAEHQQGRKSLSAELSRIDDCLRGKKLAVEARFTEEIGALVGRRLQFAEAERLLSEGAFVRP